METGKQTDPNAAQAAEGTAGELDSILDEWGKSPSNEPDKVRDAVGTTLKSLKPVIDFARTEQSRREVEVLDKDLNAALDFMAEENKDLPKRWMRGFLEGYSLENQDFANAFNDRGQNPSAWKGQLSKAREALPEWLKELPGSTVRSDLEAAKATVSGTSTTEPTEADPDEAQAIDLMEMPEAEYQRHVRKQIAKAG